MWLVMHNSKISFSRFVMFFWLGVERHAKNDLSASGVTVEAKAWILLDYY